jgi:glutamine amidotransferase
MLHVSIIDLGLNNISSIIRLLTATGVDIEISIVKKYENKTYSHFIILPGIGNFGTACEVIKLNEINHFLNEQVNLGSFLTGICLGMQLLGNTSAESPDSQGLGLIDGKSTKFDPKSGFPVPHVGWNSIEPTKSGVLKSLSRDRDFYFTHSYYFEPARSADVMAKSRYGENDFTSAIQKDNIFGFQFHPEKSGNLGELLISELLRKAVNEI